MNRSSFVSIGTCLVLAGIVLVPDNMQAGEVSLTLDAGTLTIVGSAETDRLSVTGTPERTLVRASFGTRLESEQRLRGSRFQTFEGVTAIEYVGNGGDDQLTVTAAVGSLVYTGGGGNELLRANLPISTLVDVSMDAGDDVALLETALGDMMLVDLGDGANTLSLSDSTLALLDIVSGANNDQIIVNRVNGIPLLGIVLSVVTGAGDDLVGFQLCDLVAADPMMPAILDGGDGADDQVGQVDSLFDPLPVPVNFETVIGFDPPPPPPENQKFTRRGSRSRR